tara:strand:+ start:3430 stop:3606 length:177 start_codon:yes stop_codon:yes gene_type:complete
MIKNIIIIGLLAWVIYLTGVSNFFNGIRTTVDKVEELVDNKDNIIDNINGFDNESEEE